MFGKLLKNDLKAQWHSMNLVFTATFLIAIAAEIFTLTSENRIVTILGGLLVCAALGFGCIIVIIAVSMMFSKTMFGRAGYLTLTLPVKTGTLIKSKTISGLIWIFTVYALFIGALMIWLFQAENALGEEGMSTIETLMKLFGAPSFLTIFMGIAFFLISLAVLALVAVQAMHLGTTLSHVSPISKFGNIGAIIIFFALIAIIQTVTNAIADLIPCGLIITPDVVKITSNVIRTKAAVGTNALSINVVGSFLRLLCAIGLHFPTVYLIKHKVNIK